MIGALSLPSLPLHDWVQGLSYTVPLPSPFPSASWAYVLSVLLYSGEFHGLCRHDPEGRLQYSSVNLLIFTPGQQSTSILHFLDYLALPSKLSQIRLLVPGNSSQHDILLQSFTFSACEHAINILQRKTQNERNTWPFSNACVGEKTKLIDIGTTKAVIPTQLANLILQIRTLFIRVKGNCLYQGCKL